MKTDYRAADMRIRRIRKSRGLMTQQTPAEMSGQEPSNISHIERGATKLSLPTAVNIADALGVTVDELLCDSLSESKQIFERTACDILSDRTHKELKIITETMPALKENLRKAELEQLRQIFIWLWPKRMVPVIRDHAFRSR